MFLAAELVEMARGMEADCMLTKLNIGIFWKKEVCFGLRLLSTMFLGENVCVCVGGGGGGKGSVMGLGS